MKQSNLQIVITTGDLDLSAALSQISADPAALNPEAANAVVQVWSSAKAAEGTELNLAEATAGSGFSYQAQKPQESFENYELMLKGLLTAKGPACASSVNYLNLLLNGQPEEAAGIVEDYTPPKSILSPLHDGTGAAPHFTNLANTGLFSQSPRSGIAAALAKTADKEMAIFSLANS